MKKTTLTSIIGQNRGLEDEVKFGFSKVEGKDMTIFVVKYRKGEVAKMLRKMPLKSWGEELGIYNILDRFEKKGYLSAFTPKDMALLERAVYLVRENGGIAYDRDCDLWEEF